MAEDQKFRQANRFAERNGFYAGFPNYTTSSSPNGVLNGIVLLNSSVAEWRDVPRSEYGVFHIDDVPAMFRAANEYSDRAGFPAGFPTFEQADNGNGVVLGTILIKPGFTEWRDVLRSDLNNADINDVPAMMMAAHQYAISHGFVAAFPNFHQGDHGHGVVYGLILFYPGSVEVRNVLQPELLFGVTPRNINTLVILAQIRNDDQTLVPVVQQPDFYEQFFFGHIGGSLRDYYADVTHGSINIVGTVTPWIDSGLTISVHNTFEHQAQRINAFNVSVTAAVTAGIPVNNFSHIVVVLNFDTDWGGVNKGSTMILPHSSNAAEAWSHSRAAHEFGHVLNLDDAYRTLTTASGVPQDAIYLDDHCIMSYASSGSHFNMPLLGLILESGPVLNGVYCNALGGIPPDKLVIIPANGASHTVTLIPLSHFEEEGALLIKILPNQDRPFTYWVEFHHKSGWDRSIPNNRIAVHQTRPNNALSYALMVNNSLSLNSNLEDAFITPDGTIGIHYAKSDGNTVDVRIWELIGSTRSQHVKIANIVYNPPGDDVVAGESVIIRNDSPKTVSLLNWVLRDNANHAVNQPWQFHFPDISIAPGNDIKIWTKAGVNDQENLFWGLNHAVWNNVGVETALLSDNHGNVVSILSYRV